jgi:DNA-binding CsgD family transcriptional regulator
MRHPDLPRTPREQGEKHWRSTADAVNAMRYVGQSHVAFDGPSIRYIVHLKDADSDEIVSAVRGELYLDAAVTRGLTEPVQPASPTLDLLTSREREVLVLIASGQSNKEIASHLGITERTARTHVGNLLGKLKVGSRTQAALLAVRVGDVRFL